MQCPHCNKESKAKIQESRRVDGQIWRKRMCSMCFKTFHSVEITSADMKFPWTKIRNRYRTGE